MLFKLERDQIAQDLQVQKQRFIEKEQELQKERDAAMARVVPKASTDEPRRLPELVSDSGPIVGMGEVLPRREPTARNRLGPLAPWKPKRRPRRS